MNMYEGLAEGVVVVPKTGCVPVDGSGPDEASAGLSAARSARSALIMSPVMVPMRVLILVMSVRMPCTSPSIFSILASYGLSADVVSNTIASGVLGAVAVCGLAGVVGTVRLSPVGSSGSSATSRPSGSAPGWALIAVTITFKKISKIPRGELGDGDV